MKTFFYLIVVCLAIVVSLPLTLLIIAYQTAQQNTDEIGKYLDKKP